MSDCSVILFKTGYSFISQPVSLGQEGDDGKEGTVEECRVGPLPAFAVHGSLGLRPGDSSQHTMLRIGWILAYCQKESRKKEQFPRDTWVQQGFV